MKKGFYFYKASNCYYLESIDTGSFFSLGESEFILFQNSNAEIIKVLIEKSNIKIEKFRYFFYYDISE